MLFDLLVVLLILWLLFGRFNPRYLGEQPGQPGTLGTILVVLLLLFVLFNLFGGGASFGWHRWGCR